MLARRVHTGQGASRDRTAGGGTEAIRRHLYVAAVVVASGLMPGIPMRREGAGAKQFLWQADVSVLALDIVSVRPTGQVTARFTIAADGDVARSVRVEIILPLGVAVLRLSDQCHASPSPVATLSARVTCALGDVAVRGRRDLSITTTSPPGGGRLRFAAFAFSDTPDPFPSNNFMERALP